MACGALLDRRRTGADRPAARRLGPRRRRRRRASRSRQGETGELIIGGVGLARYLDPAKDAEKYAPMPTPRLGPRLPQRRPGRLRRRRAGLRRARRRPDQARRSADRARRDRQRAARLPGVLGAAAAVRRDRGGQPAPRRLRRRRTDFDQASAAGAAAGRRCRPPWCRGWPGGRPARRAPRARSTGTPCPGRLPTVDAPAERATSSGTAGWLAGAVAGHPRRGRHRGRRRLLRPRRRQPDRGPAGRPGCATRFPEVTVADIYEHPTLGATRRRRSTRWTARRDPKQPRRSPPMPRQDPGRAARVHRPAAHRCPALRWLVWLARRRRRSPRGVLGALAALGLVVVGRRRLAAPGHARPGGCSLTAAGARLLLRGVTPGDYPRGGKVHLRLWLAERLADELGAANLAGAPWMPWYARLLGARSAGTSTCTAPAGDRDAHPRHGLLDRAGGRPHRPLDRRRRRSISARSGR